MFKAMFKKKTVLGIDIGTRNIKLALVKQGEKPEITTWAIVPTPADSVVDGMIVDKQTIAEILRSVISENKLMAKKVAVTINSSSIVVRELLLPALKDDEIKSAVQFELSQSFPEMIQTHSIAFKIYSRTKDALRGITTSCPRKVVDSYSELCEMSDIRLKYVDVNANSLAKAYNSFIQPPQAGDSVLIVDISYARSQVNVLLDGKLILSRNVAGGVASVDNLIVNRFGMTPKEAEEARLNGYKDLTITPEELNSCIRIGYAATEEQIRQTIDFCRYNKIKEGIKSLCLSGGGSIFPGLETYLGNTFRIPVNIANSDHIPPEAADKFPILMQAVGAALRED